MTEIPQVFEKLAELVENYLKVTTIDIQLYPTEDQAEYLEIMASSFSDMVKLASKHAYAYPDSYNYVKQIYTNYDSHLLKNACYTAKKLKGNVTTSKFITKCFMTMGPLSQTQTINGKKTYGYRPKNEAVFLPGSRKNKIKEIKTDCLVPLYHYITCYKTPEGEWRAKLDVRPETAKSHTDFVRGSLVSNIPWSHPNGDIYTRYGLKCNPNRFFVYELELYNGKITAHYIGQSSVHSRLNETLKYAGTGVLLKLARDICGFKVVRKTILSRHATETEARQQELKNLAKISLINNPNKLYLNAPTGSSSGELFSIKHFIDPNTIIK